MLPAYTNSYQYGDLAMERHATVRVPYLKPYVKEDQAALIAAALARTKTEAATTTRGAYEMYMSANPAVYSRIGVGFKGNLPTNSNTNQIVIEIDYRACENFQFSGENVYANPYSMRNYILDSDIAYPNVGFPMYDFTFPSTKRTIDSTADQIFISDGLSAFNKTNG